MPLFELIRNLSIALGALIGLYGLYFVVIGLNFFREARTPATPTSPQATASICSPSTSFTTTPGQS